MTDEMHVYRLYTRHDPHWKARIYWAVCECGWTTRDQRDALAADVTIKGHAPGARQYEPYSNPI